MSQELASYTELQSETVEQSRAILTTTLQEMHRAPARGDRLLGYAAAGLLSHIAGSDTFVSAFHDARQTRRKNGKFMPDLSVALLMTAHGVNNIYFGLGMYDYPHQLGLATDDPEGGIHAYRENVFNVIERDHLDQYQGTLKEKYIHSSIFGRALAFRDIIKRVHRSRPVTWADIGASDGKPIKWAAYPHLFPDDGVNFNDQTCYNGQPTITRARSPIPLERLIAVDPEDPLKTEDSRRWLLANRLPAQATIADVEKTRREMSRYSGYFPHYEFREGTMFEPPVEAGSCHVVTASTVLAHIARDRQDEGIAAMQNLLSQDGILILQDYLARDGQGRISSVDNRDPYTYGTWVYRQGFPYHVYAFESSDCTGIVRPGDDFMEFMKATE